jgi:hypothetical protein
MQAKLSSRPSAILSSLETFYYEIKIRNESNAISHPLREHSQ